MYMVCSVVAALKVNDNDRKSIAVTVVVVAGSVGVGFDCEWWKNK